MAVFCLLSLTLSWQAAAQATIDKYGRFQYKVAEQTLFNVGSMLLMDESFKEISSVKKFDVKRSSKEVVSTGSTNLISQKTTLVTKDNVATITWEFDVKPSEKGKHIELCISIPVAYLDHLPKTYARGLKKVPRESFLTLESPLGNIMLSAKGSSKNATWFLDDMRNASWHKAFRFRCAPEYDPVKGTKYTAALTIKLAPSTLPAFKQIPLGTAANRTLRDNIDGDQKGGWTDQGGNDMRRLPIGLFSAQGVPFNFQDAAIVLKGAPRPYFPQQSKDIPFPKDLLVERLCFAHTVAWFDKFRSTSFKYTVTYQDGKKLDIPVLYRVHTCDWWGAKEPLEARFAWRGYNNETEVALHHMQWKNPRPDVPIASIKAVSVNSDVVPAIVAITAVKANALTKEQYSFLDKTFATRDTRDVKKVDTSTWFECPIAWTNTIKPGSALDASFMNHAPAGKFGWLKTDPKLGAFVFEDKPGIPVRFWGTNAALYGPYPDKEDAPGIAECLARQGVNQVRIHLYAVYTDCLIAPDGSLDPVALDKYEFFAAELVKRGIYIYMDLNDGMLFERLLQKDIPKKHAKYAALFVPELVNACKKLATEFFTHKNPYRGGLRMVDDPAVCMYEITNENSMTINWFNLKDIPEIWRTELERLWMDWQKAKNISPIQPLGTNFQQMGRNGLIFSAEMMKKHLDEMYAHLRSIGVKAPICGTNITFTTADLWAAQNMDYTNDHAYFDHPNVSSRPMTYNNNVMVTQPAHSLGIIPSFTRAKVAQKPLCASEWNFCYPNDTRCEGLPLMTAYSSFQNWDSLLFYCATGSFDAGRWRRFHDTPGILVHSQQTDPATWGLSQACAIAFRNNHIRKSNKLVTIEYDDNDIWNNVKIPSKWPFLSAFARVETKLVDKKSADAWPIYVPNDMRTNNEVFQDVANHLGIKDVSEYRVTGDTGELVRYPKDGLFTVDTPCTKMATGALNVLVEEDKTIKDFIVSSPARFATVTLTSLDGKPVTTSKRMLLCVVANARNKDGVFDGRDIHNMGRKGPVLAEPVEASFTLTSAAPLTVFKLNTLTGERNGKLKVTNQNNTATFSINGAKTIYFELTR